LVLESTHRHEFTASKCNTKHNGPNVDACHLRLAHHDLLNGCKHTEHLSIIKHHCLLCDVLLHFDYAIVSINYIISIETFNEITQIRLAPCPIIDLIDLNNKAPPANAC